MGTGALCSFFLPSLSLSFGLPLAERATRGFSSLSRRAAASSRERESGNEASHGALKGRSLGRGAVERAAASKQTLRAQVRTSGAPSPRPASLPSSARSSLPSDRLSLRNVALLALLLAESLSQRERTCSVSAACRAVERAAHDERPSRGTRSKRGCDFRRQGGDYELGRSYRKASEGSDTVTGARRECG